MSTGNDTPESFGCKIPLHERPTFQPKDAMWDARVSVATGHLRVDCANWASPSRETVIRSEVPIAEIRQVTFQAISRNQLRQAFAYQWAGSGILAGISGCIVAYFDVTRHWGYIEVILRLRPSENGMLLLYAVIFFACACFGWLYGKFGGSKDLKEDMIEFRLADTTHDILHFRVNPPASAGVIQMFEELGIIPTQNDMVISCPLCDQRLRILTLKRGENYCPHCLGKFNTE